MKQNRYDSLRHNDDLQDEARDNEDQFDCDVTEEHCDHDALIGKKHGVWCSILTKLHMKKKHRHCDGELPLEILHKPVCNVYKFEEN